MGILQTRLQLVEGYWANFCDNHVRLLTSTEDDADAYRVSNRYFVAKDLYSSIKGNLIDLRDRLFASEIGSPSPASTPSSSATGGLDIHDGGNVALAQLPRITLPRFGGLDEEWESFKDLFIDIVHSNTSLGDATKMLFLKTNLDGAAAEAIRDFKSSGHDYSTAWEALCSRFDQPKLRVRDHLDALLHLAPLAKESPEKLGRPVGSWDDWFVHLGSRAMDPATRRVWEEEREEKTSEPTFEQLGEFLQRRFRTLRSLYPPTSALPQSASASDASRKADQSQGRQPSGRHVRAHTTGLKRSGCPACKEAHYIGHCLTFRGLTPEERRRFVSDRGLCFNCLSGSHSARTCPSNGTCRSCSGAHHTLIHEGAGRPARRPADRDEDEDPAPKAPRVQAAVTRACPEVSAREEEQL
ncbi:uncharacterized protein LOC131667538 [Phymastichus coffea]|uniref:uncharacterized protein LOC131667538 n=1 Tax=Phymastichus coffea TaxID=108790 RepID=UPI00273CB11A|nr:uncharacterized protein LOC131667538 [Phymastichus coffea]